MPLHLQYRPGKLSEVKGNKGVISSIKSILAREKDHPHSWLFEGPSGCGKTTLARIISKELGCAIDSRDFSEVNASNNRGIETIREIMETMRYMPAEGRCRIFLMDECHAMTKDAQNAMLKALEDTPSHVYFMLCTTESEKLLQTIRNRCSTFTVEKLSITDIEDLIFDVCDKEGADINEKVVSRIAEASNGCSRQALVFLDQIIDLEIEAMEEAAQNFKSSEELKGNLANALLKRRPWSEIKTIISTIQKTEEPERVRQGIIAYMSKVALNNPDPAAAINIIDCFKEPTFNNGWASIILSSYDAIG